MHRGCPKLRSLLLLALLLAAPLAHAADPAEGDIVDADDSADDYEDPDESDRAHLLVRKAKGDGNTVVGSNLTLTVELYNAGKRYAKGRGDRARERHTPSQLGQVSGRPGRGCARVYAP